MNNKHFSIHFLSLIFLACLFVSSCGEDETCIDGIQNQDETGVDCGGICQPCFSCSDGIQNGTETGIDCGGDCPTVCSIIENLELFTTTTSDIPDNYIYDIEIVGSVIWIATYAGVASYDGGTWTIYNTSNSDLPHDEVRDIYPGWTGSLWFATWGGGVARLDAGNWTVWNSSVAGVPSEIDYVDHLAQALNWTVVGAPGNGFLIWDGSTWTPYSTSNSGLQSDNITGIASGSSGELYLSTLDAGLILFNLPSFNQFNTANSDLPDNQVFSVHPDGNNGHWLGTNAGLVHMSGGNFTTYQTANSDIRGDVVETLYLDPNGNIWLTAQGLSRFDGSNWVHYTEANSTFDLFFANDVQIDANGRHWVGTQSRGLYSFE